MARSKLAEANEKIAGEAVDGHKKIEKSVVGGYKKIEEGVVGGFNKIADRFVDNFLTKEGESIEDAKSRLSAEQKARKEDGAAKKEQHSPKYDASAEASVQRAKQVSSDARRKAGLE